MRCAGQLSCCCTHSESRMIGVQDSLLFRNTSFQQVAQSRGPSMPFFPPAHTAATFAALAPPDATWGAPQATTKSSSREGTGGSNISAVLAPTLLLHEPRALLLLASAPLQTLLYKDVLQHAEGKAAKRKQKVVQANVARDVGRKLLAESRSTVDKLHAQSYVGALSLAVQARQLANAHGDVADTLRGQLAGKQASGKQLSSKQVTLSRSHCVKAASLSPTWSCLYIVSMRHVLAHSVWCQRRRSCQAGFLTCRMRLHSTSHKL